eukprot:2964950-Prymnesium_polylepis.2
MRSRRRGACVVAIAGWWVAGAVEGVHSGVACAVGVACLANEAQLGEEREHARRVYGDEHDELRRACAHWVRARAVCTLGACAGRVPSGCGAQGVWPVGGA